jgi:pimeloyl-ACP methyl ester carboxylesterase
MALAAAPTVDLGAYQDVDLAPGTVRYREAGVGPPIVFVHPVFVNGALWREVVPPLAAAGFRCLAPDWPLGGHSPAMRPDADLSPRGLARLVADFLAALDLRDVTLVGGDTGGGLCQLVVARHPERVGRLVLLNCDAFEHFPPPVGLPFKWGAFVPGFTAALSHALQRPLIARLVYGLLATRDPGPEVLASFFGPLVREPGVRRDLTKVLRGYDKRATLAAARSFPDFRQPVLIAWGEDDRVFPRGDAGRLAAAFPDARLVMVPGSRAFISEDQPARLAELIASFAARPSAPSAREARPVSDALAAR